MRSFAESAVVAGLATYTSAGGIELLPLERESAAAPRPSDADAPEPLEIRPTTGGARTTTADRPPTIHEEWQVAGGRLIFEAWLNRPVPAGAYEDISKVVKSMEQLVAKLGTPDATTPCDEDQEE